jgi:hypothetical protein
MTDNSNQLGAGDLVFYTEGGKIMSGGYTVDSMLFQNGQSPFTGYYKGGALESDTNDNDTNDNDTNDNHTKIMENLAIPIGIFYLNQQSKMSDYEKKSYNDSKYKQCNVVPDDLFDELFKLASITNAKTNKIHKFSKNNNKKNPSKKTRRLQP